MTKEARSAAVARRYEKARVTLDNNIEDRSRQTEVEVSVPVEGARGTVPLEGALSFEQLKAGGYIKQRQKDRFTMRLRCPGGRIPATWLSAAAEASERFGQGYVHLSFRQSLEIPYVDYRSFPQARELLGAAGVRVATCGPRVRVPTACSGCEYNPNGLTDTQAQARAVDRELFGEEYYHKFKISFSGCPIDCARTNEMDLAFQGGTYPMWNAALCAGCTICARACVEGAITPDMATGRPEFHGDRCLYCADCIRACPTSAWQPGPNGWIVRVGGRHGRHPHNASVVAWLIPDALVLAVCRVVLDWYGQHGKGKGRTRIGELLKEPGAIQSLLASLEPVVGDHLVRDAAPPEPIVIHHYLRPPAALLAGIARAPASEPTQQELTIHKVLDLCGLKCPVPQAMLKLALERMQPGQGLEVLVDEGSISALPKVVKEDGHRIDDLREIAAGRYRLHIERK